MHPDSDDTTIDRLHPLPGLFPSPITTSSYRSNCRAGCLFQFPGYGFNSPAGTIFVNAQNTGTPDASTIFPDPGGSRFQTFPLADFLAPVCGEPSPFFCEDFMGTSFFINA
jgi:hypothetical protein